MTISEEKQILIEKLYNIATLSVLTVYEAYEIYLDTLIPLDLFDYVSLTIIDLANKGESISIIKVEVCSLLSCINLAGSLENYIEIKKQ